MKKLLLIATLCTMLTSCRIIVENFYSVEDCVEWYCEKMYDAAADRDSEKFTSLTEAFLGWRAFLEDADKEKADEFYLAWGENNDAKAEVINDYAYALDL